MLLTNELEFLKVPGNCLIRVLQTLYDLRKLISKLQFKLISCRIFLGLGMGMFRSDF